MDEINKKKQQEKISMVKIKPYGGILKLGGFHPLPPPMTAIAMQSFY